MHHKRKRPKSRRAGCLLCKPHKANESKDKAESQTRQERRSRVAEKEQRDEAKREVGRRFRPDWSRHRLVTLHRRLAAASEPTERERRPRESTGPV